MEKIISRTIEDEMKTSYLDYAMSVIVGRALPDVRDGLKPVQRRILYTMSEMGLHHNQPFKKSARVVGEVLGKYHPHGDMTVYETMVRMAQDFTLRFPLIEGQGNFGSIDGDPPAAMRYTEVRLKDISKELLEDIEKNTVDFMPNYDGSLKEPTVLPSKLPNLLANGSSGIAVGMATNIPPHNLTELTKAIISRIENPDITIDEICNILKGPDFPTGGIICGTEGIKSYLKTGKGTLKVRAKTEIENITPTKQAIIIKELPYQVNKSQLLERIADVIKEGKIEDISNIRDESDKAGMRIVLELKRDAAPDIILNQLFLHTQLEETFGVIMLALVNGQPKILNILELIDHYINFRREIIYKRTKYDLEKAESRAHILEGFKIVINEIDRVIKIIRTSKDTQQATQKLMENFKLSNEQVSAILQLRLHQLTALEREKIEKEYLETIKKIEFYKSILEDPKKILNIIKQELTQLNEKYGDNRRTQIQEKYIETKHEDLIKEEDVIITISQAGYIKRTPLSLYKVQKRAEEPEIGASIKENDSIQNIAFSNTLFYLLFFTNKGKMHWIKTHEIPESSRLSTGTPLINFIPLETNEKVTSVLSIKSFEENEFIILVTKKGMIKKMSLIDLLTARKSIQTIILNEDDYVISAKLASGKDQIFIATKQGFALRFDEKQIRPTGRNSMGVTGIKLAETDEVIGCEVISSNKDIILTVTEKGYGKRTQIKEYPLHNRATKGQVNIIVGEKNGFASGIVKILPEEDAIIITSTGKAIRLRSDTIHLYGRNAQGVKLLTFKEDDKVTSLTNIPPK